MNAANRLITNITNIRFYEVTTIWMPLLCTTRGGSRHVDLTCVDTGESLIGPVHISPRDTTVRLHDVFSYLLVYWMFWKSTQQVGGIIKSLVLVR